MLCIKNAMVHLNVLTAYLNSNLREVDDEKVSAASTFLSGAKLLDSNSWVVAYCWEEMLE